MKNGSHWTENPFPLTAMQYFFKNLFPPERKIKGSVAREPEHEKKKFPLAGRRLFFKN